MKIVSKKKVKHEIILIQYEEPTVKELRQTAEESPAQQKSGKVQDKIHTAQKSRWHALTTFDDEADGSVSYICLPEVLGVSSSVASSGLECLALPSCNSVTWDKNIKLSQDSCETSSGIQPQG